MNRKGSKLRVSLRIHTNLKFSLSARKAQMHAVAHLSSSVAQTKCDAAIEARGKGLHRPLKHS